ncbi:MAG: hypothetical protein HY691_11300 [Chloroflexi bacterium]|nr:hypothetical protein [Chloroflexota bacterium]
MIAVRNGGDHEALVRVHIASFASLGVLRSLRSGGPNDAEELAAQVGATVPETCAALDELLAVGLVERSGDDGRPRFALAAHPALRVAVEAVLDRYEQERHFRTRLVLDILRRMSRAPAWG